MRHQPKVADADESRWKHVQQESAQELVDWHCHQALLVLVSGIAPAKSDYTIRMGDESMVGNRYTILAEIAKRVLGAAERAFGVNHPFGAELRTKPCGKGLRILQRGQCSMELEFAFGMQRFEAIHELAPKHCFEHIDRQEEILLAGRSTAEALGIADDIEQRLGAGPE